MGWVPAVPRTSHGIGLVKGTIETRNLHILLVGGLVAINFIFPEILGISSSQLTNSNLFQKGFKPPTSINGKNKMETTNPKVYTFYGDGSTIIRWLCTSLLFSAIGSDGRSSRAVSPKYPALPKILTLDIQDRQTFLHTNSFTHRHFYTQMLLHTEVLKQRSFYTQAPLHTDVFTHTPL